MNIGVSDLGTSENHDSGLRSGIRTEHFYTSKGRHSAWRKLNSATRT